MKKAGLACILPACLALSSCVLPIPWTYHTIPDVRGVVVDSGQPMQGVTVRYSEIDNPDCSPAIDEVVSSKDGDFYLHGKRSFGYLLFIVPAPLDSFGHYHICFQTVRGGRSDAELQTSWGGPTATIPSSTPYLIGTRCDLSSRGLCELASSNLVAVGWYLIGPPLDSKKQPDAHAPLFQWSFDESFDTAAQCKQSLADLKRGLPEPVFANAQCVARDDPRLNPSSATPLPQSVKP